VLKVVIADEVCDATKAQLVICCLDQKNDL